MIRSNYIRRGVLALCMLIMTMAAWAQHNSDSLKNDFSKSHQQDNYRKNLHGDKLKQTLHLGEVVVRDKQDIEKYAESNKYHAEDIKKITYGIPN